MLYLIISIFCSITVGVLFRLGKLRSQEVISTLFIAYIVCTVLSLLIFNSKIEFQSIKHTHYIIIFALSILLPSVFVALKQSIQQNGIARTDVIQRLSLFIPILASFYIFNEDINTLKIIALSVGLMSVYFVIHRKTIKTNTLKNTRSLIFIFIGYGIVDVLFKTITQVNFHTILTISFLGAIFTTLFYIIFFKQRITPKAFYIGTLLGMLNFFNIYTYLEAHKHFKNNPSVVFMGMNLGVICLGVLIGRLFFKEPISQKNYIGISLAISAVILLYWATFR